MNTRALDFDVFGKQVRLEQELNGFRAALPTPGKSLPVDVWRVLNYIHDHVFDPDLNVARIKTDCGVRNNNISSRFKTHCGLGVWQYISGLRMEAAAQLLLADGVEIFLVSTAVGYKHPESFCRAFRRFYGCSPSCYRDNSR